MRRCANLSGLIALIAGVYALGLGGGLIFDDHHAVVQLLARSGDFSTAHAWLELFTRSDSTIGRPLASATFALNRLAGGGLWGMKATNVAIHAFNAGLVYLVVGRLQRCVASSDPPSRHQQLPILVAALWAVHPLLVSSVLYLVQRMELLAFSCTLGAMLAYLGGRAAASLRERVMSGAGVAAFLALGYQFKETVLLVPAYILACEWALAGLRDDSPGPRWARTWPSVVYVLIALVAYAIWASSAPIWDNRPFSATQRGWTQLLALETYLKWSLWPATGAYTFFHDTFPVSHGLFSPPATLRAALALGGLVGVAFAIRGRRPLASLGIAWFFVAHAMTSAPLNLELVFEHRNYPALLGLALAAADLASGALAKLAVPLRMQRIIACTGIGILASLTALHAHIWGNPARLATHLVHVNPGSSRALLHLAGVYADAADADPSGPWAGRMLETLQAASRVADASPLPEVALLRHAYRLGIAVQPSWRASLLAKLRRAPIGAEVTGAIQSLGHGVVDGELAAESQFVVQAYLILLARQPRQPAWWSQLGDVQFASGDLERAACAWSQSFRFLPPTAEQRITVANRFRAAGRSDLGDRLQDDAQPAAVR